MVLSNKKMKLIKEIKRIFRNVFFNSPLLIHGTPGRGYQFYSLTSNKYNIQCRLVPNRDSFMQEECVEKKMTIEKHLQNIGYVIFDMDDRLIDNDEFLDDIYSSWREINKEKVIHHWVHNDLIRNYKLLN